MKSSPICIDFCRTKKPFEKSPEDWDNTGRAGNCACHEAFCLGICGLPVWVLCPAPPHSPASGKSVSRSLPRSCGGQGGQKKTQQRILSRKKPPQQQSASLEAAHGRYISNLKLKLLNGINHVHKWVRDCLDARNGWQFSRGSSLDCFKTPWHQFNYISHVHVERERHRVVESTYPWSQPGRWNHG